MKRVKAPSAYRANALLKPIQMLPAASSQNARASSSFNDGSPGEFARSRGRWLAGSQRARPCVLVASIVEIHTLPCESSNNRKTCQAARPSLVV